MGDSTRQVPAATRRGGTPTADAETGPSVASDGRACTLADCAGEHGPEVVA